MKNKQLQIFNLTSHEYADAVRNTLGKGYQHALILYTEWFRLGKVSDNNPAFNNAKVLYEEIINLTDFNFLSIRSTASDGNTGKFLLRTHDDLDIESVIIPMNAGATLCVSSQVGCRMGCSFCETGRMGLIKNLSPLDIVSQLFVAKTIFKAEIRNVVFMGMGEPFDNYDSVMQAVRIIGDNLGLGIAYNHMTISTSGKTEGIYRLMAEAKPIPNLAVSLNAPNDALRNKLMPINKQTDLSALRKAIEHYCQSTKKQVLVAYVLLKNVNDSLEHAQELTTYLKGLDVKINIIPYNAQSCDRYAAPAPDKIDTFLLHLREAGFQTLLRQTKGDKIMAACGQLGNLELRKKKKSGGE